MQPNRPIQIQIWSDYVCPFCYLEKPILEQLKREQGDLIEIRWRAFELRPEPVPTLDPKGDYLKATWARAVYPLAEERGMVLRLPPVQPRSRRAFEAVEFARAFGKFEVMHWALFRSFFEEGMDLNHLDVLIEIGAAVGLPTDPLRTALQAGQFTQQVLDDEGKAMGIGIQSVPTLLITPPSQPIENSMMISGAQPYEVIAQAIELARKRDKARPLS